MQSHSTKPQADKNHAQVPQGNSIGTKQNRTRTLASVNAPDLSDTSAGKTHEASTQRTEAKYHDNAHDKMMDQQP